MIVKFLCLFLLSFNAVALDDFDLFRYGPEDKIEVGREGFVLKLVFYTTHKELQVAFKESSPGVEDVVRGFTYVSPTQDVCEVHIVKPELWDDREILTILGHEVMHCTFAEHKVVVGVTEVVDVDLDAADKKLELEMLEEECKTNTKFDFIAGCKELENKVGVALD